MHMPQKWKQTGMANFLLWCPVRERIVIFELDHFSESIELDYKT